MHPRHKSVGTYPEDELTYNWSANARSQLSQLAEPLWAGPGLYSEISAREQI